MFRSRIAGTGSYLPDRVLTNIDLEGLVDTSDQWIRERTGIERRHLAAPGQRTSDLCYRASVKALESAGLSATDLDLIIIATITGDQTMPSTACYVQEQLGCRAIPAFDLAAACSGFLYALTTADQFIRTGVYKNILIVGAEVLHNYIDYRDRETCILFGDGAGAFVVSRTEAEDKNVVLASHLQADGSLAELLVIRGYGSRKPMTSPELTQDDYYVKMKGREVFKHAVRAMAEGSKKVLEECKLKIEDVAWLVPHQANIRIMSAVAESFNFPESKVINVIREMGNTSAATIPIAFDMAVRDGRIKRGQVILMTAFGAGLTAGTMLLRF